MGESNKAPARSAHVLLSANNKAVAKLLVIDTLDLHFDVVARKSLSQFILVNEDLLNLRSNNQYVR